MEEIMDLAEMDRKEAEIIAALKYGVTNAKAAIELVRETTAKDEKGRAYGFCYQSSKLLATILRKSGYPNARIKWGYVALLYQGVGQLEAQWLANNFNHAWVEVGQEIIDVTAEQFQKYTDILPPPIVRITKREAKSGVYGIRWYSESHNI